ncbi:G-type lectin S-receptor-like serine/threonine-protein kinase SD3-1 [Rutidosis leptorrhynchoides]|uniref:G-type lectin S-receptor-like serine/threonine-protein kinase SD3-1 n=1 Tax=Rutidosis leptorrhynchoides TaxID=125765 RepID=UPI003A9A0A47
MVQLDLNSHFLLYVSVGFMLLHIVVSLSQIPLGSKLSVAENKFWVSSNGDFSLGYFNHSDLPNWFGIGISINSKHVPTYEQTVVWVAGPEISVSNQSFFQLTENGELVLYDSLNGQSVWTSKTSQLSVASSAFLRDDGNLVLLNDKGSIVWQSFDTPSDTILPGQNLSVNKTLRATSRTSMTSYYSLHFNTSGQLQLRWESDITYWTSKNPNASNVRAVLTSNGVFQLLDGTLKTPLWSVYGDDHNDTVKFRFLRLDADGNLRMYSWTKDSNSWRIVWQAVENQCNVFATCGEHGFCVFNATGFPECKCPYDQASTGGHSKCLVPYKEEECGSNSSLDIFNHTHVYGFYPVNDSFSQANLHQCKALCKHDRHCTAVTFTNEGNAKCKMMTTRYVTGYSDPSLSSVSYIKQCANPVAVDPSVFRNPINSSPSSPLDKKSNSLKLPCLVAVAAGAFLVFIIIQVGTCFYIYRRQKEAASALRNSKGLITLSFDEIKQITENFKHQTGPTTFKGTIDSNQPVTIKMLEQEVAEERKFRNAVLKIGNIHHKNLVKLKGYCCELGHRYLVYEYAKNGSLQNHMGGDCKLRSKRKLLTWQKRVEICLSVARAICYLHTECREFISHGDLKIENVVLDENLETKLTEFGLKEEEASAEKDVEDFGKMVLTLLSGCQENKDICEWSYREWIEGRAENVVDKRLIDGGADVDFSELERCLRIAFWCVQQNIHMRPSMGEVVKVLEGTLTVDPPPPPLNFRETPPEEQDEDLE